MASELLELNEDSSEPSLLESSFNGGRLHGLVDYYGYHQDSNAWYFVGWIDAGRIPSKELSIDVRASFASTELSGRGVIVYFFRPDVGDLGSGFIVYLPSHDRIIGRLAGLGLGPLEAGVRLSVPGECQQFRGADLGARLLSELSNAQSATATRDELLVLLQRKGFAGQDTVSALKDVLQLEFDGSILCAGKGIVLMGWLAAERNTVRSMRLRSGTGSAEWTAENMIKVPRPDVVEAVPLAELDCGFVAWLELDVQRGQQVYVEVETSRREIAYKQIPAPSLSGIQAIKRILSTFDLRYSDLVRAFDNVIGPSVRHLQSERKGRSAGVGIVDFGTSPERPRHSVIVPLYGRIDFLEYQLALFSQQDTRDCELIYVLDDPPRRRELLALAESAYQRFAMPFRVLLLERNLGYAPANNVGLRFANGEFVCFLNSDVIPDSPLWLDRLSAHLQEDDGLGAIGPVLLFENGSVQHQGMDFEILPEFGSWRFPLHPRKGLKPPEPNGALLSAPAITGACLMLPAALARELGGFDEEYIIGDFEDSDLCMRIAERGLRIGVDPAVRMFHLERKSQAGSGQLWRMNMTLYNAWLHQSRWFGAHVGN